VAEQDDWTVERHLASASPHSVELVDRFIALVEACGPFTYHPSKTTITLKGTRRGFAGVGPRRYGIAGYLDLMRPVEDDPRITNVTPYTKRLFVHSYRIETAAQLDEGFAALVAEAYAVGAGEHLRT
jgi:hypothetical protein